MDRYDTFWLSCAPKVQLPGGEPCFPGVPQRSPQQVLAAHGLKPGEARLLDPKHEVSVTPWRRGIKRFSCCVSQFYASPGAG
jgi:hypothetical protein